MLKCLTIGVRSVNISSIKEKQNTVNDIEKIIASMLSSPVETVHRLSGGANGQVYHVACEDLKQYVAKFYFRHQADTRDRLGTEFSSLSFLWEKGIRSISKPVAINKNAGCAVYEYIEGKNINSQDVTMEDINVAVRFLEQLKKLSDNKEIEDTEPASEACFSIQNIIRNIEQRLERLEASTVRNEDLINFLKNEFKPLLQNVIAWCPAIPVDFNAEIARDQRTLSPSDFGFHNALKTVDGRIIFLDFEYFGWDDPAKMISDFLLHPAMTLSGEMKKQFMSGICNSPNFSESQNLARRVELVYPLFGLKWCLIFLNEFVPDDRQRRDFAQIYGESDKEVKEKQLLKAKAMLALINETYQDFPYKLSGN